MSGILIAFIAQILIGASLLVDKILLKKDVRRSVPTYVFWIGILNIFGIALFPFGFATPPLWVAGLALATGAIFLAALFFYYRALTAGEVSHTLAIVGGFTPIATFFLGSIFLSSSLNVAEYVSFGVLTLGGFVMFFSERFKLRAVLPWVLLAALFFGLANVLEKLVFDHTNFITGFVLTKAGAFLAAFIFLLVPRWKACIIGYSSAARPTHRLIYFSNRIIAGLASFLILYAISLEHPALVEAIGGFRYAVIFIGALLITRWRPSWLKEIFRGWTLAGKILATLLIIVGLTGLALQNYYENQSIPEEDQVTWGVTFSSLMAKRLGLDWRKSYGAILEDLRPAGVRIVAYWPDIEPQDDQWDFADLDWQMDGAQKAGVPVILAIGQKVPRWPECHVPEWAQNHELGIRNNELLEYLEAIVVRYRDHPALMYWQVENEPFLRFGECPHKEVAAFVDEEIVLVKSLDSNHSVLMTDGGEFGDWYRAATRGDAFGTTLYRKVYNDVFGHITYPLTPEFYPLKRDVIQFFTKDEEQEFIVIELGLEPWDKKQIHEISVARQRELFDIADFEETIDYARRARFDTYYMWGAEWWYWLKVVQGDERFWEIAKSVIE